MAGNGPNQDSEIPAMNSSFEQTQLDSNVLEPHPAPRKRGRPPKRMRSWKNRQRRWIRGADGRDALLVIEDSVQLVNPRSPPTKIQSSEFFWTSWLHIEQSGWIIGERRSAAWSWCWRGIQFWQSGLLGARVSSMHPWSAATRTASTANPNTIPNAKSIYYGCGLSRELFACPKGHCLCLNCQRYCVSCRRQRWVSEHHGDRHQGRKASQNSLLSHTSVKISRESWYISVFACPK